MTRPYSEDLRERAVARFEAAETIRSIGGAFGIDPSCAPKWVKRRRETGSGCAGADRRAQAAHAVGRRRRLAFVIAFTPAGSRRGAWQPNWRRLGALLQMFPPNECANSSQTQAMLPYECSTL